MSEQTEIGKLREGLERLSAVLRAEQWAETAPKALNPGQARILRLLLGRGSMRIIQLTAELGLSQPTVTVAVSALARKGLVARQPDPADGRASQIVLTDAGRQAADAAPLAPRALDAALAGLGAAERADLLLTTIKLVRALQVSGALPAQRLCLTCRHFRPHAHPGAEKPHHCGFVDAAFGTADLRLDCGDHEAAPSARQAVTWQAFNQAGAAPPST